MKAENLKTENSMLNDELAKTIEATALLERESKEAHDAEVKRHAEELNPLKKTTQQLKVSRTIHVHVYMFIRARVMCVVNCTDDYPVNIPRACNEIKYNTQQFYSTYV